MRRAAQAANRRVRDAAVEHVADDRDVRSADFAELFAERIDIEQRLRRMRVDAVARIDDVSVERQRDALGKTGFVMADDDDAKRPARRA